MENISHFHQNDLFFYAGFSCETLLLSTMVWKGRKCLYFDVVFTEMNQDILKMMLFSIDVTERPDCAAPGKRKTRLLI